MKWEDISQQSRTWMEKLGHFGPTVNAQNREIKGCMLCDDGDDGRVYFDSRDLHGLASACIEVAEWLEQRASAAAIRQHFGIGEG